MPILPIENFKAMNAILLSSLDNIVVLVQSLPAGATVVIGGKNYHLTQALGLGHKLAARKIQAGEKILKYGVPIGSATRDISAGEHVHLHNIKSDYLPTFTLEEGREYHRA
jgi:SAF domain